MRKLTVTVDGHEVEIELYRLPSAIRIVATARGSKKETTHAIHPNVEFTPENHKKELNSAIERIAKEAIGHAHIQNLLDSTFSED